MDAVERWLKENTYSHSQFDVGALVDEKLSRGLTATVCLPTKNVEETVGLTVSELLQLGEQGLIDQLLVIDADSDDSTVSICGELGVEVTQEAELCADFGPCMGKGDALWRSLSVVQSDLVVFVDSDSASFGGHYVSGLLGPLISGTTTEFVKGLYERPYRLGGEVQQKGGGRVTELTARPLLNLFYPQLAGVAQPLSGEVAARKSLLMEIPFYTNYAVEISMLIDIYKLRGLDTIAQVDLGIRENAHKHLVDLGPMASAVLQGVVMHAADEGRVSGAQSGSYSTPDPETKALSVWELGVEARPPMKTVLHEGAAP